MEAKVEEEKGAVWGKWTQSHSEGHLFPVRAVWALGIALLPAR